MLITGSNVDHATEIKQEPNKSGGGEGQWSAWKVRTAPVADPCHAREERDAAVKTEVTKTQASKLAQEYEKRGGDYENEPGSKNEPKKGDPERKSDRKRKEESQN